MTEVQGLFSTASVLASRRKYSTSDKLWISYADVAKIAVIARSLQSKAVTDPKFRWFEQDIPQQFVTVNNGGGYNSSATSIVVDDSSPVRAGTVLKSIASDEQLLVTANVLADNTMTVKRGWGETSGSAIANDAYLMIIGDANREGASLPEAITREPVEKFNYTGIFREPVKLTETEAATDLYPEASDMKTKREIALQVQKRKIEKSFIFGEPEEDTATYATPVRATGGLLHYISTNVESVSGTLTEAIFESWISDAFAKGEKKMGFLSPLISSAVSYWAKNKLQMAPANKTYGIAISEYVSPHGSLKFTTEKLLNEHATLNGYGFILDLDNVGYRYLAGNGINRDMRLRANRQASGDDLIAEEYLTECGLFLANESFHSVMKGVNAFS